MIMVAYTRATVPADWECAHALKLRGRVVVPGTRLKIAGERGTFAFARHVRNVRTGTEWLDVRDSNGALRAFRPERVRSIPRHQPRRAA